MHLNNIPTINDIQEASIRIANQIHKTPVLTSSSLNKMLEADLYFKCENFQKIGAFKMRGASNAIKLLSEEEKQFGVATHSSGNFAQALALSAKINNIKSYIVMPENASKVKINAVKDFGGEVILCKSTLKDREETLNKIVKQNKAIFIHPYDNYDVIAGQATCAKELIEEINNLDFIIAPVGGGGLISGTALSTAYFSPNTIVLAGEPFGADDAYKSLLSGKIEPSINPNTIADGLRTSLGERTFPVIQKYVKKIIRVEENEIIEAMRLIWERLKIIVEPSSAVAFAAIIKEKNEIKNKKVGIILSGGNVDLNNLYFSE